MRAFNIAKFRKLFPEFSDSSQWPDSFLNILFVESQCFIWPDAWHRLRGDCQELAQMYMTAHLASESAREDSGEGGECGPSVAGPVVSATIDRVSVTVQAPPVTDNWQYWLASSPYGKRLMALLAIKSVGGFYVGGSLERRGFRKFGGGF